MMTRGHRLRNGLILLLSQVVAMIGLAGCSTLERTSNHWQRHQAPGYRRFLDRKSVV